MSEELPTPGQIAYEAYFKSLETISGWNSLTNDQRRAWRILPEDQKRSWEAAGHAVVKATTKQL